ncbi:MAG TPA: ATP-binding protein [Blastocatellia bacterium]|nr:ATP-binding protein [Blastocatellia bacterium]
MGKLIREMDWSKTPLGPIENWPQSLRTTVSLCLASNFPISIAWGPQRTQIYNDGYWPICGAKHPHSMGQDFKECWFSAWPAIGEAFERATAGETTFISNRRVFLDRHGYLEETFFTFSFSPILDESGGVGGLFHPVTEMTQQTLAERRMRVLRDLADLTVEAKTVTAACDLIVQTLAAHELDTPFALLYLFDADGSRATLAGSAGLAGGSLASPEVVAMGAAPQPCWPLSQAASDRQVIQVDGLEKLFGPLECGPYPESPQTAFVLPISISGLDRPFGLLVAGVSSRRELDDAYRTFYLLLREAVTNALTNARDYEEERKRAEALAELDRAKTAFFSNVSHEFRTPLTLMLGPLEDILAQPDDLPLENRERLEVAHRNSLRLLKLVNSLLDFSRIEAGRIQASYEPTDLASLTADLASVFRSAIERAGLKLIVDCPPLSEAIYVDREMWEKIVLNLISNAFKFTFSGEIEVSLRGVGKNVELSVRDTGTGIPPEEVSRLFERFYRVKGARGRSFEGSGIGLALVQELVKLQGGTVWVESELDKGSVFTVSIPFGFAHLPAERVGGARALSSTATDATAFVEEALRWLPDAPRSVRPAGDFIGQRLGDFQRTGSERLPQSGQSGARRILLADDNADMREYVRRLLAEKYEVEAVADGEAALQAAREHAPDLILTDVMMPNLDGFGLLCELRADEGLKTIPVILLSARAGEESRSEGMEAGADDYLIKPFSARELMARVEAHLKLQEVRRQSQEALRASEWKFSAAFEQSPLALAITSLDDERLVEVNESYVRLTGYTRDEAIGRTSEELKIWVDPGRRAEWLRLLRAGERVYDFEISFRTKRGRERVCLLGSSLIEINSRPHIVSSFADITDRRWMEELLRESQERLRFALESAQVGDWDLDLITGKAERSFLHDKCFGATEPFAEWSYEKFLSFVHPEDLAEVDQKFGKATAEQTGWHFECRVIWPDGSIHWIEAHGRVYHTIGGKPSRMLGVVADITKRKQAEEEIARLLAEEQTAREIAEQATRAKDEFLAMVSHELRSPLNAILGWNRLLRSQRGDDQQIARVAETVENSGKAQLRLIEDLLDTARIVSGKMKLETRPVELVDVISSALNTVRPAADSKGIVIVTDLDPEAGQITGDPGRLEQIVWNLVSNAIKFTPEGGWVWVELRRGGPGVQIIVRDSGQGIGPDVLPYVFDRFKQADSSVSRRFGGLGLGLALVKHLVELHGGGVTAESPGEGRGSTFTVNLPARAVTGTVEARSRGEREAVVARPPPTGLRPASLSGIRALVVDDEADALELITLTLEQYGAIVTGVNSAADALAALESHLEDGTDGAPFDVLISDIGMPGADGYELIRRLRSHADKRVSGIHAVALTAYARTEDRLLALQAGFHMHVPKPVDEAELTTVIAALTGRAPGCG